MKKLPVLSCIVLIALILSTALSMKPVMAQDNTPENPGKFVPGEIVVAFKAGKSTSQYVSAAADLAKKTHTKPVKVGAGGVALLKGESNADLKKLAKEMKEDPDVLYAEPNFIYKLPDETTSVDDNYLQRTFAIRQYTKASKTGEVSDEKKLVAVPISDLQSMKTKVGSTIQATYPSDPYVWWNAGWDVVDADIVSSNATVSAGVCVLDTGVDYLHPDLSGKVLKGYDYVNGDADPMDDYGHGTHVAGIITAKKNTIGMVGASTATVVAVKVLGSQGWGTNYDIAQGINYCANRTDVKVLNMSLGGDSPSDAIYFALQYAAITKGKLVVTSAGNDNADSPPYPAFYAYTDQFPEFTNKVLAVGASGQLVHVVGPDYDYYYTDYNCRAEYSNYGDWVSVVAPGSDIYSTTPYDKPFYMNYFFSANPRYEYLSGTSMAAPFVAAAAARRWGYKPLETNAQIGYDVINSGYEFDEYDADNVCWPSSMLGRHQVNIANLLDRYEAQVGVVDASTGIGLNGTSVGVYKGITLLGSAVITPSIMGYNEKYISGILKQTDIFNYYTRYTTIINLPEPTNGYPFYDIWNNGYVFKANKINYTISPQPVWQHEQVVFFGTASINLPDPAAIPPKSSNIEVVGGFTENWLYDYDETADFDLDANLWLPSVPNPLDASQIAPFIIGPEGYSYGYLENDPSGSMTLFPFARYKRDGGGIDSIPIENITISSRKAHAPLYANAALPYYPGSYVVGMTDWGQTFDHDTDIGTTEIPVLGAWAVPYIYIWKDGVIKLAHVMPWMFAGDSCNAHWWKAATITSGVTGAVTYTPNYECSGTTGIFPY